MFRPHCSAIPLLLLFLSLAGSWHHPGRTDERLARLFLPHSAERSAYRVFVSDEPIERLVAYYKRVGGAEPPGAWRVDLLAPLDAFGSVGPYDRSKLAMLYGGRRAHVAHGPLLQDRHVVEAVTLVSPYPDATLSRLVAGTMIIVVSTIKKT